MSEKPEARKIDKSTWGAGPWQTEPDRIEWEHVGLTCLMLRTDHMGNWCGYVAVPPGHPWHGHRYSECVMGCETVPAKPMEPIGKMPVPDSIQKSHMERKHFSCQEDYQSGHTPESIIDVHGGLTYSGLCSGHICHVPKPGQPDNVFWFGFDCAHGGDGMPGMAGHLTNEDNFFSRGYKDVAYVRREVEHLADQLKAIA